MPLRRSTGKPSITKQEAEDLRQDHITKCLPSLTESEMCSLRHLHVMRTLVPLTDAVELRGGHLSKIEPAVLFRLQLCRDSLVLMERDRVYYGVDEIPERVVLKLDKVIVEKDDEKARGFAHHAWKCMEMHCLAAWARGKAPGPPTRENLERRAKRAESLVSMLESKDQPIAAEKQRRRAAELRSHLTQL